jgi:hypothetical protein
MAGANTDITSLGALASVNGGQLAGLRNRVINGGMGVWQRGTSGTLFDSVLAYSADRMFAYVTGANVSFLQGGAVAQAGVASHLIVLGAAGSTGVAIGQRIENLNTADLDGKQITFSAWVYTPDSRAPIFSAKTPNGVNDYSAATPIAADTVYSPNTSGWRKIYFIVNSAPASIANGLSIEMQFGAAAAGINIACTALQLEVGSVATSFEHRPYGLELALCQRYYETVDVGQSKYFAAGVWAASQPASGMLPWKVTKRASPTITFSNNGAARYVSGLGVLGSQTLTAIYISPDSAVMATAATFAISNGWLDNAGTAAINAEL